MLICRFRLVDPDLLWQGQRLGRTPRKAFGMGQVGRVEDVLSLCKDDIRLAVMDHGCGQKHQAGIPMLVVVPGHEVPTETAAVWIEPKRWGRSGRYFMVMPRSASRNATGLDLIDEPRIGVQRRLFFGDFPLGPSVGDQLLRKFRAVARSEHPAHDLAARDVHDQVGAEVAPRDGTLHLGDVPTPDLIGLRGEKLRLFVSGMPQPITAFTRLATIGEQSIHGADRTIIEPSSSRVVWIAAGDWSWNGGLWRSARTSGRSARLSDRAGSVFQTSLSRRTLPVRLAP